MASSGRPRPQIYVHFEFGVSWTQRHNPRPHALTYMSRNLRERTPQFPRHVPPPTTNFLSTHQQARSAAVPEPQIQPDPQSQRRNSRQSSRPSSHERGRSAPPPFNDSPWDAEPEPLSASVLPTSANREQMWKDLPAAPSQYRLGDDGMPWAAWAWPGGYQDPDAHSTDGQSRYGSNDAGPSAGPSTFSPQRGHNDFDGRQRELEALSAAMMTVDNGFEDQWWFQGPRETVAGDLHTSSAPAAEPSANVTRSVGWAIAQEDSQRDRTSAAMQGLVISPLTEHGTPWTDYETPPPTYSSRFGRSWTTRSEDLYTPL